MNSSHGDKGEQCPGGAPVGPRISTVVVWGPLLGAPRVLLVPAGSEDAYVQAFAGAVAVCGDSVVLGPVVTGSGSLVGGAVGAAVGAGLVPPVPWPIPQQEPCAGGRLLSRHVFWDCRARFWHLITRATYQCPDGQRQTIEEDATVTSQECRRVP